MLQAKSACNTRCYWRRLPVTPGVIGEHRRCAPANGACNTGCYRRLHRSQLSTDCIVIFVAKFALRVGGTGVPAIRNHLIDKWISRLENESSSWCFGTFYCTLVYDKFLICNLNFFPRLLNKKKLPAFSTSLHFNCCFFRENMAQN